MTHLPIGTPVQMTAIADERGLRGARDSKCGVVVGYGRSMGVLRVLRIGRKHPESWHKIYWQPMNTPEQIVEATL